MASRRQRQRPKVLGSPAAQPLYQPDSACSIRKFSIREPCSRDCKAGLTTSCKPPETTGRQLRKICISTDWLNLNPVTKHIMIADLRPLLWLTARNTEGRSPGSGHTETAFSACHLQEDERIFTLYRTLRGALSLSFHLLTVKIVGE